MEPVNLRSFKQKVRHHHSAFKKYLGKVEKKPPRTLNKLVVTLNDAVWKEIDCLTCANCCKTMTPTFTNADMKRIAAYLNITVDEMKNRWLHFDKKDKDWVNDKQPCQFLNLKDNKCSIYAVRPQSCAGFPHLTKKPVVQYLHVHQQNVQYCPATYSMVEKMMEAISL
ncbi:YkgJ family cysteine cluster protein [Hydrotalea sp.]|uniref:YkgJ family cysteine cluster protein n=1 Tax=Hydrotalea sp. TaxID=2881279 RepID=UPI003D0CB3E2